MIKDPLVSVIMITYNHEKFIKKAIDSVLMQETDFDYELIVCNDKSPDNTDAVIRETIKGQPESRVKYYNHEKNLGMMPNFLFALNQAKGKYIAILDGDDYWTSKQKLQKQARFLENNPDFAVCHHNVYEKRGIKYRKRNHKKKTESTATLQDLARGNYIHSCTLMLKNITQTLPPYFNTVENGDYFLTMLAAREGKIKYFPDVMAVYRLHGKSVWSQVKFEEKLNQVVRSLTIIKQAFSSDIQEILDGQIARLQHPDTKKERSLMTKIKRIIKKFK